MFFLNGEPKISNLSRKLVDSSAGNFETESYEQVSWFDNVECIHLYIYIIHNILYLQSL